MQFFSLIHFILSCYNRYLDNQYIKVISNTEYLTSLVDLSLAHNELTNIKGIGELKLLKRLNLSYNKIAYIDNKNIEPLINLQWLDISYNKIENLIDTLDCLSSLTKLTSLLLGETIDGKNASSNTCCKNKKYPLIAFEYMPNLHVLDGSLVSMLKEEALNDIANRVSKDTGDSNEVNENDLALAEMWIPPVNGSKEQSVDVGAAVIASHESVNNQLKLDATHMLRKADKLLADTTL
jgi:hypothetical protein